MTATKNITNKKKSLNLIYINNKKYYIIKKIKKNKILTDTTPSPFI